MGSKGMQRRENRTLMVLISAMLLIVAELLLSQASLAANRPIRLLVPPLDSPTQVYARFKPLAEYLSRKTGQPVQLVLSRNLEDFSSKVREPVPQLAYFCPLNYVTVTQKSTYTPLAGVTVQTDRNRSVILVRHDSPIHRVMDLKGRSLALGNVACAASFLIPRAMLQREGITLGDFLEIRKTGSDQAALMAVAARLYDVTASSESTAQPFIRRGILRAVLYSQDSPPDLIAANALVPAGLQQKIRRALLTGQTPTGQLAGHNSLRIGAFDFVSAVDSQYDVIREMKQHFGDEPL